MVYIYEKEIQGKKYYYLRISQRIKGKLAVKDIAYLGSNLSEVEKNLDKLPKYQQEIRKSHRNIKKFIQSNHYIKQIKELKLKKNDYLNKELLEQIEAIKLHFNKHFLKFDHLTIKETYEHFQIDFAFNTTSIEGNTITLQEAARLLKEDILPNNKTLREVNDLQNTEKVFFWLLEKRPAINENLIIKIHDLLLENIDVRKGYRTQEIRVFKSKFEASPAKYVAIDMKLLFDFINTNKELHPLVLAGIIHHKMEKIHPFADGNGRTGRMLMNYILIKNNYPPLIVPKKRRADYLKALSTADKANLKNKEAKYYQKLINYLAEEMVLSYWNNFNV